MVHLITGYAGKEHIQSRDTRSYNAAMFGSGEFVMEIGNQCAASIINNHTVRIFDGDILMQGGHIRIESNTYEDMTIETGTAGKNRIDLIVMTYEKNSETGIESAFLEVIKGDEYSGTPTAPDVVVGTLADGDLKNQMILYKVKLQGVVLASAEKVFETIPTYKTLAEQVRSEFNTWKSAVEDSFEDWLETLKDKFDSVTEAKLIADVESIESQIDLNMIDLTAATVQNATVVSKKKDSISTTSTSASDEATATQIITVEKYKKYTFKAKMSSNYPSSKCIRIEGSVNSGVYETIETITFSDNLDANVSKTFNSGNHDSIRVVLVGSIEANNVTTTFSNVYMEIGSVVHSGINQLVNEKAEKSTTVDATLLADSWEGVDAPHTYTLTLADATPENNIELILPATATSDEVAAYQAAMILNGTQSQGSITLYSWGDAPEIDLPLTLIVRGD